MIEHLRSREQFSAVMAGAPVAKTLHFALHRCALGRVAAASKKPLFASADAWLGVLLPKRWARRAVTRNAIRRQIYAVAGEHATVLASAALVVRLRREFSRQQFVSASSDALKRAVRAELQQLLLGAGAPPALAARPRHAPAALEASNDVV